MKILLVMLFAFVDLSPVAVAMQEPPPPPLDERPPMGERPPGGPPRARRIGPDRRPPRPPEWNKLPEEERDAINGFMQEHFPRMVVELERLKESAPQRYERRMDRVAHEMRRLMDAHARDPRRATAMIRERQLSFQLQELSRNYQKAGGDEEKARIRRTVRELAGQEFDNRLERRHMEVRELETKLAELKTRLEETESVRDEMVERRAKELLDPKSKRERDDDEVEPREGGGPNRAERGGQGEGPRRGEPRGDGGPRNRDDRGPRGRGDGPPPDDREPRSDGERGPRDEDDRGF